MTCEIFFFCFEFSFARLKRYLPCILVSRGGYSRPYPRRPLSPFCRICHTCLFSINVPSVTVSKRRVENCSSGTQSGSQSRVEFRRSSVQSGRQHCLHDPQPTLCVVPLLARNACTAVDQANLPYFLVVLSMGLAYPDTTNPSRVAVGGRREEDHQHRNPGCR